ncbi:hypothetical protein GCM10022289_23500 [Pedobacter jeongneungensis]|uniref:Uncharacterized protein n=1 Tax=Pedobacter jeongneungensis TaxID=947309 RepID=A0ABP8BE83_9SPHI
MITTDPVKPSAVKKDHHNSSVIVQRYVGAICAIACFVAILRLPIVYYTFLRTIISLGALIFIYSWIRQKNYYLAGVFALVLILFNPVSPIYLYKKSIWIPLDIITGILFLIIAFYKKSEPASQEEKAAEVLPAQKTYYRDRIIATKREK